MIEYEVSTKSITRSINELKNLLAEAEAYAVMKKAATDSVIQKMQLVRDMMRDFYQQNTNANLTGEEFSRIISSIVSEMGRL